MLDLFSGIGGFSLGARMAGFLIDQHYYSDISPYALRVYAKNFPDAVALGDVTRIDGRKLRDEHPGRWIVCGGFPCQDISAAGKQRGLAGARSGLWFEMLRLIDELRPDYVVGENVRALTYRGLDRVLGSLAEIGYDAEWEVISARAVGAPHLRERLWLVAYPQSNAIAHSDLHGMGRERLCELPAGGGYLADGGEPGDAHQGDCLWPHWQDAIERREMAGEPLIRRVPHGLSDPLDISWRARGTCLGNAVVPQIPAIIFRQIMQAGV